MIQLSKAVRLAAFAAVVGTWSVAPAASHQSRRVSEPTVREEPAQSRRAQGQESDEIQTVRRRLKVMRSAVDSFLEAGDEHAADRVERAMHVRELAIEGRREEAARLREAAPNRGELSELLGASSKLWAEWGHPDRAKAVADLSATYEEQWQRQQRAEREGRTGERSADGGLDSLERRVKILEIAYEAYEKAGQERNARALGYAIRFGELQLAEADDATIAAMIESVPTLPNLTELMAGAAGMYRERGAEERAAACANLADYYRRRLSGGEGEQERAQGRERPRVPEGNIEELAHRVEIIRLAYEGLRRVSARDPGRQRAADQMAHFLRVAELQLAGAPATDVGQAFEGLTMGTIIELVQRASGLYAEWGMEGAARKCNQLAEFYAARERARRQGAEQEQESRERNLEDRAQRIDVLRLARAAHREAGHQDAAGLMERIIHLAELQLEGAGDEAVAEASEGLSMEMIRELVASAAHLYDEWGVEGRAAACNALVDFYIARDGEREDEFSEEVRRGSLPLEDKEQRMEILRLALAAHAEAGNDDSREYLERTLHLSELQLAGASGDAIAEASEGISMEGIISAVRRASELYRKWNAPDRADWCAALADFYVQRDRDGVDAEVTEEADRERAREAAERERTHQLLQRIRQLQEELRELEMVLRTMLDD